MTQSEDDLKESILDEEGPKSTQESLKLREGSKVGS